MKEALHMITNGYDFDEYDLTRFRSEKLIAQHSRPEPKTRKPEVVLAGHAARKARKGLRQPFIAGALTLSDFALLASLLTGPVRLISIFVHCSKTIIIKPAAIMSKHLKLSDRKALQRAFLQDRNRGKAVEQRRTRAESEQDDSEADHEQSAS
jgi:hypothetical protein